MSVDFCGLQQLVQHNLSGAGCPKYSNWVHRCSRMDGHPGKEHKCDCGYKWEMNDSHPRPYEKVDETLRVANDRFATLNLHEALLASGTVRRYHTHPHVIGASQTVAEHTFRCCALMISLWPECTPGALKAMLCHDGAEGAIGDISSTVKRMHPDLGRILDTIEEGVQSRLGMPVESDQDNEAQLWIRICDWLEGALYSIDQMAMGNKGMAMCHNAFILSLNRLPLSDEVRDIVRTAHHKYFRHPNGMLKVDLGIIELIDPPAPR